MQLPRTLSPAFCGLLALAVQHVAGLVVPRGAPDNGIGAEVENDVGTSLTGGVSHPTPLGSPEAEADAAAKAKDILTRGKAHHSLGPEAQAAGQAQRRQADDLVESITDLALEGFTKVGQLQETMDNLPSVGFYF